MISVSTLRLLSVGEPSFRISSPKAQRVTPPTWVWRTVAVEPAGVSVRTLPSCSSGLPAAPLMFAPSPPFGSAGVRSRSLWTHRNTAGCWQVAPKSLHFSVVMIRFSQPKHKQQRFNHNWVDETKRFNTVLTTYVKIESGNSFQVIMRPLKQLIWIWAVGSCGDERAGLTGCGSRLSPPPPGCVRIEAGGWWEVSLLPLSSSHLWDTNQRGFYYHGQAG